MSEHRQVRVASSFLDRLDELFRGERSATGLPSTADFLLHRLPPVMDALAEDYEGTTLEAPGLRDVGALIAAGSLILRLAL